MPSARSSARCTSARSRTVNSGKSSAVRLARRGVDRRRPGRALAAAEQVRADDVEAIGVDRLARADQRVPPDRGLGVAGQRVADVDDRVRRVAVAGVGDLERRERRAGLERQTVLEERASQPRVRLEEMTPVSKPARCRPPLKRACSIFTQRLETTSRPASYAISRRLVAVQAELHPERARARLDRLARDARELVRAAEDVDDVRRARQVRQRRVALDAEDRLLVGRDRPDLVVGARRQQVREHEVARAGGLGGRADDGDRLRAAQDREPLARRWAAVQTVIRGPDRGRR